MADIETGWERSRRTHFNDIVEEYDKIRPDYPCELFEDIINYSVTLTKKSAVEIGAGTGKSTAHLLNSGYDVTAVEISPNMANFLLKRFNGFKGFNVKVSSFEDVVLQENSYDLIYAASAFHWVDSEIGCPKAFRLLKNKGTIALFRYNAVADVGGEIYEKIQTVYEKYYYSYYTASTRPIKKSKEDFNKPSEIFYSYRFEDLKDYGFNDISMKFYDSSKTFNAEEYIALLETMSDHGNLPPCNRINLYDGIKEIIMKYGNSHKVDYIFQLYMGRK